MGCISDLMLTALFKVQWCKYRLRTIPKGMVRSGALGRETMWGVRMGSQQVALKYPQPTPAVFDIKGICLP